MNKKSLFNPLKINRKYLALMCSLPLLVVTCKNHENQAQRKELDNQISNLSKEIEETQDFRTAKVPNYLQKTQSRYIDATDSLTNSSDTIELCVNQNDSLVMHAFNNYATRIGRDFQISKFLPQVDILTFQEFISGLDSADFTSDMAHQRIMNNTGSMHDLSYFLEAIDFDSINTKLCNKLMWNFYSDTSVNDFESNEIGILEFENPELNKAIHTETELLNRAWALKQKDTLHTNDTVTYNDSTEHKQTKDVTIINYEKPNFDIPEFDSIRIQYTHNDSLINRYTNTWNGMTSAEDSLIQYRQAIIRKRDSLINKRQKL